MADHSSHLQDVLNAPEGPHIAALFDFDGTIIAGYSATAILKEKIKRREMTAEEIAETMQAFQQQQMAKMQEEQAAAGAKNAEAGEAFLAENGKQEGVVTTDSGLQYKVVTKGDGAKPKADDLVSVHYKGTLLDGKEFDSSYKRGEPAEFGVNQVIPGWTEALQLMPVGSKWELVIPADLAYGPGGAGGDIGPNSTLQFEVELLEIKDKEAAAAEAEAANAEAAK